MTTRPWTNEEKLIVYKMREDYMYRDISDALAEAGYPDRSSEAVRCMLKRDKSPVMPKITLEEDLASVYKDTINALDALRTELTNLTVDKYRKVGRPKNATTKILSISDMHIPFYNQEVILDAIKHHHDADVLVLNGDIFDVFAVSKWPKSREVILRHEFKLAVEWLKFFSKHFPKIILTAGNHEKRIQSYFSSHIEPSVSFLVSNDIITKLVDGYDVEDETGRLVKRYDHSNVYYEDGLLNWYTTIGKCIFAHPSAFSSIPMRTSIKTAEAFLEKEEFQCLVLGHTHKMGKIIWRNRLLIEQGCCCVPLDYEADSTLRYALPQSFGYAVIYMDKEGNVDFDKSQPVYYGTGSTTKINEVTLI